MVINEKMKDTERMAIKLKNGSKIVITRHYLEGKEYYLVNSSGYTTLTIAGEFFDSTRSLLFLQSLIFDENDIRINAQYIKNMSIKTIYFANDQGYIDTFEASYVPEPEEPTATKYIDLFLDDVDKVITDPDMFNDMLNSSIIDATSEELAKYDLVPTFSLIEGEKVKFKGKKQ